MLLQHPSSHPALNQKRQHVEHSGSSELLPSHTESSAKQTKRTRCPPIESCDSPEFAVQGACVLTPAGNEVARLRTMRRRRRSMHAEAAASVNSCVMKVSTSSSSTRTRWHDLATRPRSAADVLAPQKRHSTCVCGSSGTCNCWRACRIASTPAGLTSRQSSRAPGAYLRCCISKPRLAGSSQWACP
jgi:hypothetical protein